MIKRKFLYSLMLAGLLIGVMVQTAAATYYFSPSRFKNSDTKIEFVHYTDPIKLVNGEAEGTGKIKLTLSDTPVTSQGDGTSETATFNISGVDGLTVSGTTSVTFTALENVTEYIQNDTFTYKASAVGTGTLKVNLITDIGTTDDPVNANVKSATKSITIEEAVAPEFDTSSSHGYLGTVAYGAAFSSATIGVRTPEDTPADIEIPDIEAAQAAVAESGLTLEDWDTTNGLTFTGVATKIGEYKFNVTPRDTVTGLTGSTKEFRFVVKGTVPTIYVTTTAPAKTGNANGTDYDRGVTGIGKLYDTTNKATYVGKDIEKDAAQATEQKIYYVVVGSSQDLTVTAKWSESGSGLSVVEGPEFVDDGVKSGYFTGVAAKEGTYHLIVTATNAETKRQNKGGVVEDIIVPIKPAPYIEEPTITTIVWSADHTGDNKIVFQATNADDLHILTTSDAAIATATKAVWLQNIGQADKPEGSTVAELNSTTENEGLGNGTTGGLMKWDQGTENKGTYNSTTKRREVYIEGQWKPQAKTAQIQPSADPVEKTIKLIAQAGEGTGAVYVTKTITLRFVAIPPVVTFDEDKMAQAYKTAITADTIIGTIDGGGDISLSDEAVAALNAALPKGVQYSALAPQSGTTLWDIKLKQGAPIEITPKDGKAIPVTATSKFTDDSTLEGTTVGKFKVTHTFTEPTLNTDTTNGASDFPEGWTAVGKTEFGTSTVYPAQTDLTKTIGNSPTGTAYAPTKTTKYLAAAAVVNTTSLTFTARDPVANGTLGQTEVELFMEPGPIDWKADNLPSNVVLTPDKNDTRFAYLQFKDTAKGFNKPTDIKVTGSGNSKKFESKYTITATNKYLDTPTKTFEKNLVVWERPTVTAISKNNIKVDDTKDFEGKLTVANVPTAYTITMDTLNPDTAVSNITTNTQWNAIDDTNRTTGRKTGKEFLKFDADTATLKGKLDVIPEHTTDADGKEFKGFKMSVLPQNFAGAQQKDDGTGTMADKATDFYITVKGEVPVPEKLGKMTIDKGGQEIEVKVEKGTENISLAATIEEKDAKNLGLSGKVTLGGTTANGTTALAATTGERLGFTFTDAGNGKGTGKLVFDPGTEGKYAFKDLPITITATNREGSKSEVYKITVEGDDLEWATSLDKTYDAHVGSALTAITNNLKTFTQPLEVTVSPNGEKNGLTATPDNTAGSVSIAGTPREDKETSTAFTVTATNLSTKQKAKVKMTVHAMKEPVITTAPKKLDKEVIIGKKLSVKPAVKGSKGYKFSVTSTTDADTLYSTYGISLDVGKGLTSDATKKVTVGTVDDVANSYKPIVVTLKVNNISVDTPAGGEQADTYDVTIGIKGEKPKLNTKTITIKKDDSKTYTGVKLDTTPKVDITKNAPIHFDFDDSLPGIDVKTTTGELEVDLSSLTATKGTNMALTMDNAGSVANAKVKFVINDKKPVIEDFDIDDITAKANTKVTQDVAVEVDDESCTGDTKIKWAVKTAPKKASAKIKANDNGKTATLTLTVAKKLTNANDADINDSITITATNQRTGEQGTKTVKFTIVPVAKTALPEGSAIAANERTTVALPDVASRKSTGEGEVKLGQTRTVAGLSAGDRTIVNEEGYIIAAVLPEVTVTEDGQYDLNVELAETVAEGAELKYFAFPRNAEASEDDEICDFYDDEGKDVEAVPESHKITIAPWFNADVTYAPVIAVKADTDEEGAKTVEEIEEVVEAKAE